MAQISMARKKRVSEKYSPNTWRVISQDAEMLQLPKLQHTPQVNTSEVYTVLGQRSTDLTCYSADYRRNRPNAKAVGFLRQNVALLNEPICDVHTRSTAEEQSYWWPSRANETMASAPVRTMDTTSRCDYQYQPEKVHRSSAKHDANHHIKPARGAVPVTKLPDPSGRQRFWQEGLSYEHQFNCRTDPQYSIRGKRHGSFVWNKMSDEHVAKLMREAGILCDVSIMHGDVINKKMHDHQRSFVFRDEDAGQNAPPSGVARKEYQEYQE